MPRNRPESDTKDPEEIARPLFSSFGYLLRILHLRSTQRYAAILGEQLQFTQYVLLQLITHHPGETQSALALAAGLDRTTIVPIVDAMVRKGWVRRVRRRDNRRAYSIRLTPAGEALAAEARAAVRRNDDQFLETLAPDDRARLLDLLHAIVADSTPITGPLESVPVAVASEPLVR